MSSGVVTDVRENRSCVSTLDIGVLKCVTDVRRPWSYMFAVDIGVRLVLRRDEKRPSQKLQALPTGAYQHCDSLCEGCKSGPMKSRSCKISPAE